MKESKGENGCVKKALLLVSRKSTNSYRRLQKTPAQVEASSSTTASTHFAFLLFFFSFFLFDVGGVVARVMQLYNIKQI